MNNMLNLIKEVELQITPIEVRKEVFRKKLNEVLDGSNNEEFKERLMPFLELANAGINKDLIVNCVCDSSYLQDFIAYRCPRELFPHIVSFIYLIKDLQQLL